MIFLKRMREKTVGIIQVTPKKCDKICVKLKFLEKKSLTENQILCCESLKAGK